MTVRNTMLEIQSSTWLADRILQVETTVQIRPYTFIRSVGRATSHKSLDLQLEIINLRKHTINESHVPFTMIMNHWPERNA